MAPPSSAPPSPAPHVHAARVAPSRNRLAGWLLVVNLVAFLVPPIPWALASGDPALAIGYFAVTGALTVASLLVLAPRTAEDAR